MAGPETGPQTGDKKDTPTHVVRTNKPPAKLSKFDLVRYNLNENYKAQIINYYDGDQKAAMRFMTGGIDYIRRVPKLMECDPLSVVNSLMTIASFRFIPSSVAGEAYIIPYGDQATFQIGYKGYVTLFFRAGVKKIYSDIIREKDTYSLVDGELTHTIDMTLGKEERGAAIGAYVRATLPSGETVVKYMNAKDIIAHAKRFSKSFTKSDSPWNSKNDPELNMWKKTVLLQLSNVLPKNDELVRAMEEDFKDSTVSSAGLLDAGGPATPKAVHTADVVPEQGPDATTPEEVSQDPEKCKAGKHHVDYEDAKGVCSECEKEKKSV